MSYLRRITKACAHAAAIVGLLASASCQPNNSNTQNNANNMEQEHYTFKLSEKVTRSKVSFNNRFGITLVADLYMPNDLTEGETRPAIAISGPFGAVKEQSSGLYANTLASRGFIAIAFDPSFTGESSGEPRYVASPDINTEDFQAAVDYLTARPDVSAVGICGICGWGGLALNAAAIDTRIKATVASTMYDMTRVNHNGYFDSMKPEELKALKVALNEQRNKDFANGTYALAGGVVDPLPADAPDFVKDYYAYYKTPRGYHERSLNSNGGWNQTSALSFINSTLLTRTQEIESAVLVVHGEKAHSRYFSETAFANMTAGSGEQFKENKTLMIIPDASHTDLYDNMDKIPFDDIEAFFTKYVKP